MDYKEYELLAKNIADLLLKIDITDEFKTIKIEHNIKLKGKSGQSHQIDVYWEYELNDKKYKAIIECKDYKSNVSIAKVRDFFGVCYDLREDDIQGFMLTTEGFQKGCLKFAEEYGIKLYELREKVKENDFDGLIQKIDVRFIIDHMMTKMENIVFDQDYLKNVCGLKKGDKINLVCTNDMIIIEDNDHGYKDKMCNFENKVANDLVKENISKQDKECIKHFEFDDCYFQSLIDGAKYKIKSFDIKVVHTIMNEEIQIDASEFIKLVIKDVINNNVKFIKK